MRVASPNILLLLSDQERYDVSHPNGPCVDTPHMDTLRDEGMTFERAYTPTSICSSARASLLSGYYPHTHGMRNNCHEPDAILRNLPSDIPTFGEFLTDAGYENTYIGKWHVGVDQRPEDFGFDYRGGGDGSHENEDPEFREYQRQHGVDPDNIPLSETIYTDNPDPVLIAAKAEIPPEATRAHYMATRTIETLREHGASEAPFFHRLDFVGPHHPYTVPEPYASMYDPDDIDPWVNFDDDYHNKPTVQERYLEYRGVAHLEWDDWAEAVAKYFGFVTLLDHQIGRILAAVDEYASDNTVVVHTADHGDFAGSHRQFNKGPMMYEETYHIPLMVRWPEVVEPGSTCDEFVRLLDLMPTFLELADEPRPSDIHGRSLVPLLQGVRPPDWPETLFAEYHGDEFGLYTQRMVRSKRYKYVYNTPDIDELYDLEADPGEVDNRIDDPAYQSVVADLQAELLEWMERTDDMFHNWSRQVLGTEEIHG